MKNLTIETTRYMMDAMAYAYVAATLAKTGETPDPKEVDKVVRDLFQLYCFGEQLAPTGMEYIGSLADEDEDDYEEEDEDYYEEEEEEDDDEDEREESWESWLHCVHDDDNDDDEEDDILSRICEALIQSVKKG